MEEPTKRTEPIDATDASTTDLKAEQLTAENADLRSRLRASAAREPLAIQLAAAGARTPALLLDAAADAMQFGDDGGLANTDALVASLRTRFPEQFRTNRPASIDGGAGRSLSAPLTREALAKMKPAEIAKLDWAVVRRVLSEK